MKEIKRGFCLLLILFIILGISLVKVINDNDIDLEKTSGSIVLVDSLKTAKPPTVDKTNTNTRVTYRASQSTRVVSGIGEIKGNVDPSLLNDLNSELNRLPSSIINAFVNEGWHIYLTDENISNTYFNGRYYSVEGATIYESKIIVIEARKSAIYESTIHEMGHFVDYENGFTSESNEFSDIYNNEVELFKSRITNSSCVTNKQEFFAETFYYMYKDSSKCTEGAYNYINGIL